MSFNRLNYDMCQYKQTLFESTGPGNYLLGTPPIDCDYCFPYPPTVRLQKAGDSINRNMPLVDTSSELLNITRKASKCCEKKWKNECMNCGWLSEKKYEDCQTCQRCSTQMPNNAQTEVSESFKNVNEKDVKCGNNLTHFKKCFVPTEDTRLSDPACNLRGTGFNRWEWLCLNPQEKALVPFDYNISNRIVVKDNHRACIPKPIDQRLPLPAKPEPLPCQKITGVCGNNISGSSAYWRNTANNVF